ncbi:hypothetical protein GCM10007939_15760 [Amylibacter marinus]|uniref:Secreted protein n=1 Tax=Amylibacter marinus TaxID=1475483 RepID=A0ABQ5VW17_9RHOB|nr:hypothetical protein GCM10007939_15760 [Amylibacter marinus]
MNLRRARARAVGIATAMLIIADTKACVIENFIAAQSATVRFDETSARAQTARVVPSVRKRSSTNALPPKTKWIGLIG